MLYLILHKVRGEPAFDIAQRLDLGEESFWIIPTSGHRAYPYLWWDLENLIDIGDITASGYHDAPWTHDHTLPADWPDHYQTQGELQRHPKVEPPAKPAATTIEDLLI